MPGLAAQQRHARGTADSKGDTRVSTLAGGIPLDHAGIGDTGADCQRGIDGGAEAQYRRRAGRHITVDRRIVRRQYRGGKAHPVGRTVQGGGVGHIVQLTGNRQIQVIGDPHVGRRQAAIVDHADHILQLGTGLSGSTTDHEHLLGDRQQLDIADHHNRRLIPIGIDAIRIGRLIRQLGAAHRALVADEGPGRSRGSDLHIKAHRRTLPCRDHAGTDAIRGVDSNPGDQGRNPAIGLPYRRTIERDAIRNITGIGRHGVGQCHAGGRNSSQVGDDDGVAQGIARVDDAHGAAIDLNLYRLMRIQQRHVADHIQRRVIQRRSGRIIGQFFRGGSAGTLTIGVYARLVRDNRAIERIGVDHHIEGNRRHIGGGRARVGAHHPGSGVLRRINQQPGLQRRYTGLVS